MWFDDLTAEVRSIVDALPWSTLLPHTVPNVTDRTKTLDTLREKLVRLSGGPLHNIVDISGIRVDAEMTTSQQDDVAAAIESAFNGSTVKDLRGGENAGYRAVHVHIRHKRAKAEIQIRTEIQSKWANTYERLGDVAGRGVRYGQPADEPAWQPVAERLREISLDDIAHIEKIKQLLSEFPQSNGYVWQNLDEYPEKSRTLAYQTLESEATLSTMLDDVELKLRELSREVER